MLSSPRMRRRLLWLGLVGIVLGSASVAVWLVGNTGREYELQTSPPRDEPAQRIAADTEVPFTNAVRQAVLPIASRFIATAVQRKKLDEAWTLIHPELRQGWTLERWRTGEIPVVPYPVGRADWDVGYSFRNTVGLYVLLTPRQGSKVQPTLFVLELKRLGTGKDRRWLVSSWVPSPGAAQTAAGASASPPPVFMRERAGGYGQGDLSPLFLIVPVAGTLGVIVVGTLLLILRGWRRNRRALRSYERKELPPLPRSPSA